MDASNQNWPSSRIIHLMGGIRAINIDSLQVLLEPKTLNGKTPQFNTRSYGAIYADLQSLKLPVVGVDFYSHTLEIRGESPPNWRVFNQTNNSAWPSEDAARIWNGIAHSAFKKKLGHIWDVGSRIGHQLRVCSWRVRQLSEAYHQQLVACSAKGKVDPGRRFEDGFTWNAYLAVQSYLVDACILRDYLSEFLAAIIYTEKYGFDATKVSTVGGLIKQVLKKQSVNDPLTLKLSGITGEGGWLKSLGEYRDLVVHSAPLAHADKRLYAIIGKVLIDSERVVPKILLPLPSDPAAISAKRASRPHFSDFESQINGYVESVKEGHPTTDALSYIVETHGELAGLAAAVAAESPVPYQELVLTEKDLIGPVKITKDK